MIKTVAPAKINIHLDILGEIGEGFHSLFMVMQSVGLADEVTAVKTEEKGIFLDCSDKRLPQDEKNIAYKAAKAYFDYIKAEPCVKITVTKNIPFAAGLAGGSADAAAVIVALNELLESKLSQAELCEIGLSVGSDVPFCIVGGTCLSQNRGEVLSQLKPLKKCFVVLAKPQKGVSTAEAYAAADKAYIYHPDNVKMLAACSKGDFEAICSNAANVFEQVIEVPERVEIKNILRRNGAKLQQMSGSGPTVFGLFTEKENAEKAAEEIKAICPEVYVTETLAQGAKIIS